MFCFQQELDTHIYLLSSALKDINFCAGRDTTLARSVLSELKTLSFAFNKRLVVHLLYCKFEAVFYRYV